MEKHRAILKEAMLKKELRNRLLLIFAWLLVITLLRWNWRWELIGFWLGGLIGTFFLDLDHWFYVFWLKPHELTSQRVKHQLNQNHYREALILLSDTKGERIRLSFFNAPFQLVLYLICFFVLTSTANLFGAGLVMAMALSFLKEEFGFLFKGKTERLTARLFWPLNLQISSPNLKFYLISMLLIFIGLNLLLI